MPIVNGFLQIKEKDGSIDYLRVSEITYIHEEADRVYIHTAGDCHVSLDLSHFEQAEIFKVLGLLGIAPEVFGTTPSPKAVNIDHVSV